MFQAFSENATVAQNAAYPLNNVTVVKGDTVTASGNTIQINRCGVYEIKFNASVTPEAAGLVSAQISRDGVLVPQAKAQVTGATDSVSFIGFTSLVQCDKNNTNCCCSSPVNITIVNNGAGDVTGYSNIVVTKIC